MPIEEVKRQHTAESARMAASDSEYFSSLGEVRLREADLGPLADMAAQKRVARAKVKVQAKKAASAPREASRSQVREHIVQMMRRERAAGTAFKTLMQRWENEPIDDLVLTSTGERYTVADDANGEQKSYTWGSLSKLYSAT